MVTKAAPKIRFRFNFIKSEEDDTYPSGTNLDVAHGAVTNCLYNYADVRTGLHSVECRACGVRSIMNIRGASGTVRMACNLNKALSAL